MTTDGLAFPRMPVITGIVTVGAASAIAAVALLVADTDCPVSSVNDATTVICAAGARQSWRGREYRPLPGADRPRERARITRSVGPILCRVSDDGSTSEGATNNGGRRPKASKEGNRGEGTTECPQAL